MLARYFDAVLSGDPVVRSAAVTRARVHVRLRCRARRRVALALPAPLAEFVLAFDAQRYPELVGPEVPSVTSVPLPG